MQEPSKLVKIGFFTLLAIALLYFGLNYLKGLAVFGRECSYYARFTNVEGLSVASPVKINGYKVGTVQGLEFEIAPDGTASTLVQVNIDRDYKIPRGTRASIKAAIFGGAQLDLQLATSQQILAEGDFLETNEGAGDPLGTLGNEILPRVAQLIPKVDSILSSTQQLLATPELKQSIHEAHATLASARSSMQKLDGLMTALQGYTRQDVAPMLGKANSTLTRIDNFSQQLDSINVRQIMTNLETTSNELHALSQQLNSKEGTLGKVINDEKLYEDLRSLLTRTDSLVTDFKAHPRKYINLSIF
ncbi:MAG: MlaD family protein [Porphyromonas endodontalis]|uniref:MlaD family protein n=1 Tax=Porphyromonas endodontalis TaxID=28124 RepID=UPI0036192391